MQAKDSRKLTKSYRCGQKTASTGCCHSKVIQATQPFPEDGLLAKNLNLPLSLLAKRVRKIRDRVRSYIVTSVKMDRSAECFEQRGSAPNFQGDILTLCTCKHQMRTFLRPDEWENNYWLAGFTSRTIYDHKHWLFYLAKIESALESHSDLWNSVDDDVREAKAAHLHFLGDMFQPKMPNLTGAARYSPSRYYMPRFHAHRRSKEDTGWYNDINYRHAAKYRYPSMLVADPHLTFLWKEPTIFLKHNHCRNNLKWSSLQDIIAQLQEVSP